MSLDYLKGKKILLVDDEDDLLEMLRSILQDDGYRRIRTASTQKDALELCRTWKPELAVLDVMLPDGDGYTLFKEIRRFSDFPVLFLTARGEDEDRFRGLGLGADDYIVKPFLPRELTLRLGAILRRSYKHETPLLRLAYCTVDFERADVIREDGTLSLTAKEFELLSALSRNAGRIVTTDLLCEALWGNNPYGYENSLMAHIRRLREKIEKVPSCPESLITVKGLGYKLIIEEDQA